MPRRRWALLRTRVVPRGNLKTWHSLGLAVQNLHAKTRISVPVPGPSAPGSAKPAWSRDPNGSQQDSAAVQTRPILA